MKIALLAALTSLTCAAAHADALSDNAVLTNTAGTLAIQDVSAVTPTLFRGPRLATEQIAQLAQAGIRLILNLQGKDLESTRWDGLMAKVIPYTEPGELQSMRDEERKAALANGMFFTNIPISSLDPVDAQEDSKIRFIIRLLHDMKDTPIYIHCEHGRDRTGLIIALYRIRYEGWSIEDARAEWARMGHRGYLNYMVTGYLDQYFDQVAPQLKSDHDHDCQGELEASPAA